MADESTEEAPSPTGGGSKIGLIVAGINVVLTGFVAFQIMSNLPVTVECPAAGQETAAPAPIDPGPIVSLDSLVVNLNEPGSTRYLKVSIEVRLRSSDSIPFFEASKPEVRHSLLRYFSNLSIADTQGSEAKEAIEKIVREILDKTVSGSHIQNVFFSQFVVQ